MGLAMKATQTLKSFKTCPCCGKTYHSREDICKETTFVGVMEWLELYNCSCGTTLALKSPGF